MAQELLTANTGLVLDVLGLPIPDRNAFYRTLTEAEFAGLLRCARRDLGTLYGLWADDPVGFCRVILGVELWSVQREIILSVEANKRTVVPSCHGAGKTFDAAMVAAWFGSVHRPEETVIATTAPRMRQVRTLLWPHIRRVHTASSLLGETDMTQWKYGDNQILAYGFSAANADESAVQGIHATHLLLIGDEAGGINHSLGRAFESVMTGGHTRILLIGNPPTDEEGSFFEERTKSPLWTVIRIPWSSTPNATGEDVPDEVKRNLIDQSWVDEQIIEFGADSAFVMARVHAEFPHGATNKTIPWSWIEAAMENEDPEPSTWIRLGVDVAADGGDEFVIAQATGTTVTIVHNSSGQQNANPTDVAGKVVEAIAVAEQARTELGETRKVRVKIDSIGVGWGVHGLLKAWGEEGIHDAEIIAVNVAERAKDEKKFTNKRAEMWWNARELCRPRPAEPGLPPRPPVIHLDLINDKRAAAQLNAPTYGHDSQAKIKIEKKADIKKRGISSPDRAEAILLALYEPVSTVPATMDRPTPGRVRTSAGRGVPGGGGQRPGGYTARRR